MSVESWYSPVPRPRMCTKSRRPTSKSQEKRGLQCMQQACKEMLSRIWTGFVIPIRDIDSCCIVVALPYSGKVLLCLMASGMWGLPNSSEITKQYGVALPPNRFTMSLNNWNLQSRFYVPKKLVQDHNLKTCKPPAILPWSPVQRLLIMTYIISYSTTYTRDCS